MKPLRFLHAADLHLDSPFKGMSALPFGIRERVREATFVALYSLTELAVREKVDFVVISGDVYDLADRSLRAQMRFQKAMERLAEYDIPVFVAHGNHDPLDGLAADLRWPDTVHFFSARDVECLPVYNKDGGVVADVHGISYGTSAVTENLAVKFRPTNRGVFNIAVLHTNVDGAAEHDNYAPCSKQDLLHRGMDYWALGHIHTRRVLHREPLIVYPGNTQGRNIRETGAKGCYIVEVYEYGEPALTFHALDAIRWFTEDISIEGIETIQALRDRLDQQLEKLKFAVEGRASIIRFYLKGRGPIHSLLQNGVYLQELLAEMREEQADWVQRHEAAPFVWIESMQIQSGGQVDLQQLMEQNGFLGDLLRIANELLGDEEQLRAFGAEALQALQAHPKANVYAADLLRSGHEDCLRAAMELAIDGLVDEEG